MVFDYRASVEFSNGIEPSRYQISPVYVFFGLRGGFKYVGITSERLCPNICSLKHWGSISNNGGKTEERDTIFSQILQKSSRRTAENEGAQGECRPSGEARARDSTRTYSATRLPDGAGSRAAR
jgi:hypothetical protein